jgi:SAM-dependent methyltransferase
LRGLVAETYERMRDACVGPALRRVELAFVKARDAKRLAQLDHESPRLHLGCGAHPKPGWVNIDLDADFRGVERRPGTVLINYDLARGLPLADDICDEIYSSHFFEHLPAVDGARLFAECHRVLRPGGRLRTCLPDFERLARAYLAGDEDYFAPLYEIFAGHLGDGIAGSTTIMDAVNNGLYQFGEHRCMYDRDKLETLLRAIGFAVVEASSFDPTIDGTWDAREHFSFYVDAFK